MARRLCLSSTVRFAEKLCGDHTHPSFAFLCLFKVAKLTNDVSLLTEGVSLLRSTLVGVIRIDPILLLEDGIRCELVAHVATALDKGLTFNPKNKVSGC